MPDSDSTHCVFLSGMPGVLWFIDGRSPQAYLVAHALPQTTMEAYEKGKGDMTDKSIVEIPEGIEFPREVKQFKVGSMQVFECPAADDSKPIVLYIHGGAYVNNFSSRLTTR